jgi:hypothetical protein
LFGSFERLPKRPCPPGLRSGEPEAAPKKSFFFFEYDLVGKPVPIFPDHAHAAFCSSDTTVAQGRERGERIFAQSGKETSRTLNQGLHLRNKLSAVFIIQLVGR